MARPLLSLVSDARFHSVQVSAAAALSNIVMEFSPMKAAVLDSGGIRILATLLNIDEPTMDNGYYTDDRVRRYCLCALKNMVCQATLDLKREVVKEVGWERLMR